MEAAGPEAAADGRQRTGNARDMVTDAHAIERHFERSRLSSTGRAIARQLLGLVLRAVPEAGPPELLRTLLVWKRDGAVGVRLYTDVPHQAFFTSARSCWSPSSSRATLGWTGSLSRGHERHSCATYIPSGIYGICVKSEQEAMEAAPVLERLIRTSWMTWSHR